jgi:small subunit ribosomal protein S19
MSRSISKGPNIEERLLRKLQKGINPIKTYSRASVITSDMVGVTFMIHNGKSFIPKTPTPDDIGHKLGEFSITKLKKIDTSSKKTSKGVVKKGGKK